MRFTVDTVAFHDALKSVAMVVKARSFTPALECVKITAGLAGLHLYGTNLEQGIRIDVPAGNLEVGDALIPAKLLLEFVGSVNAPEIAAEGDEGGLTLVAGTHKARVKAGGGVDDLAYVQEADMEVMTIGGGVFSGIVNRIAFAAARDEARPALMCVHMRGSDAGLRLEAADGFRLAIYDYDDAVSEFDILIPARSLELAARLMPPGPMSMRVDDRAVTFSAGGILFTCLQTAGTYPGVDAIIPTSHATRAFVDRDNLLLAVRLAYLFNRDAANITTLVIGDNRLVVSGVGVETGDSRTELPAIIEGEPLAIAFNAQFLIDALSAMDAGDVRMGFVGDSKPGKLDQEHVPAVYVIMPMGLHRGQVS